MTDTTRRAYLAGATAVATGLAGCLGSTRTLVEGAGGGGDGGTNGDDKFETATGGQPGPPLASEALPLPDDTRTLSDSIVSGGVSKDGIPSIDEPQFIDANEANDWLDDGEPVFGVNVAGDLRAYPQRVLVWHEIVNDDLGGHRLTVTYCPLTGTAQGFERGDTEFGVSGRLLNSNLVMYDRDTDSYWPQMLATAVRGEYEGNVLREFPVTWTTWGRWREVYPETIVLSDDTGFARNYDDDPYGEYNPREGFYANDSLFFDPYTEVDDSELQLKDVVVGARSGDGAIAVEKAALADAGLLEGTLGATPYVAVYEPTLDTGYVYRNSDEAAVEYDDGTVSVDGDEYDPDVLPLDRVLRYDAFWFAWAGYYPNTALFQ